MLPRVASFFCAAAAIVSAQSFDAASVKPLPKGADRAPFINDPGHFSVGSSLLFFIAHAYDVGTDQVIGPDWLSEEYSVNATIPSGSSREDVNVMLQNLLAERFRMKTHQETRVVDGYNLVIAKGGPKLKPAAAGQRMHVGGSYGPDGTVLEYIGTSTLDFMRDLTILRLRRPTDRMLPRLVDKTGLTGYYNFTLRYIPPGADAPGPDLFQALEGQLGLKLEPARISVKIIVVDHAEKLPLAN